MSEPVMQGPRPSLRPRHKPPESRSSAGPMVFLLVVAVVVVALVAVVRPLAEEAAFAYIAEHDTLLKQDIVRSLIASRVQNDVDLSKDSNIETREFVIARGETASEIGHHLEEQGIIRSALAFEFVLYENGTQDALQSGTYKISSALSPRDLAKTFEKAPGEQTVLRIIEGWRLTEIWPRRSWEIGRTSCSPASTRRRRSKASSSRTPTS